MKTAEIYKKLENAQIELDRINEARRNALEAAMDILIAGIDELDKSQFHAMQGMIEEAISEGTHEVSYFYKEKIEELENATAQIEQDELNHDYYSNLGV